MAESKITRAAVGRIAKLGDLYDVRKDTFICLRESIDLLKEEGVCEGKENNCGEENSSDVGFLVANSINKADAGSQHKLSSDDHFDPTTDHCMDVNISSEPLSEEEMCEKEKYDPGFNNTTTCSGNLQLVGDNSNSESYMNSVDHSEAEESKLIVINAFKKPLKEEDIYEDENECSDFYYITTEELDEQFEKLGIEKELKLSIMSGLVKPSGSAAYLSSQKRSSKRRHMTLIYTVNTIRQEVDGIRSKVNKKYLDGGEASHIVVGIDWGVRCYITCEYQMSQQDDEEQVKGKLQAELNRLKEALSVENSKEMYSSQVCDKDNTSKFLYHINIDLCDHEKGKETTFEGALSVTASLLERVLRRSERKGTPLCYTLMSLNYLRKVCKLKENPGAATKHIEEHTVDEIFDAMNLIRKGRQQISDFLEEFNENKDAIPSKDFDEVKVLLTKFETEEAKFKSELGSALIEARSGYKNELSTIEDVLNFYLEGGFFAEKNTISIGKHERTIQKLQFINECKDNNVLYIGKGGNIEKALETDGDKIIFYALYMDHRENYTNDEEWRKQTDLFLRLVAAHREDYRIRLIVVDCEFHPTVGAMKGMCIQLYNKESCCWEDLPQGVDQDIEECIIEMALVPEAFQKESRKQVSLEIRCPKSVHGSCSKEECQWICTHCKMVVAYGIDDDSLYCSCGKASPYESKFRCNDIKHGLTYTKFDLESMNQQLSSWKRTIKETNIVILGETGVGKSTWINAIANYYSFETLQEAIDAKDMKVCIPSTFTHNSRTGGMQTVSVGSASQNEVQKAGQSATQVPRAYRINFGKQLITLLDTPGLADTRGLEKDKENVEDILGHLSHYDKIHGICILLKSNNSRLSATFIFCVTEFLRHLHKSAADNIVFCFTNTRNTFYEPGDTLPILKQLLSELKGVSLSLTEYNQFCFDNEAFRFLACLKSGIQFNQQDIDAFSLSWTRSLNETNRLLKHVHSLTPHSVKHTVNLNNARRVILELNKPLVETTANIGKNIELAAAKLKELQESNKTAEELQGQLYLDQLKLGRVQLGHGRTVCTDVSCIQYVKVKFLLLLM